MLYRLAVPATLFSGYLTNRAGPFQLINLFVYNWLRGQCF
jgi:hypothetical protein